MLDGRFSGAAIVTPPSVTYVSPGRASSQLPPASAARSTITEPGFIPCTASALISFGAGRPGTSAVVTITSDLPICTVSARRWISCSSGRELAGVAAGRLGVADALDLEEARAERLDLLLDRRADVEAR